MKRTLFTSLMQARLAWKNGGVTTTPFGRILALAGSRQPLTPDVSLRNRAKALCSTTAPRPGPLL
jgi:hypothetical protein